MSEIITEHREQIELFAPHRWPKKPYCSDDLENGLAIRSFASALQKPYIQANPPNLRVWSIFDLDRPGAAVAWEDAGLPPPSWSAMNRQNGHAHLVWGLSVPVLVETPQARRAPMRYLAAIEEAFAVKLQSDRQYTGLITKNPAHPLWRTLRGPRLSYDLSELAEWIDLPKHLPKRQPRTGKEIGVGRNVALFDNLRLWAYKAIRRHRERNFAAWKAEVLAKAFDYNDFPVPLDAREVGHIAKSVAKGVWGRLSAQGWDEFVAATHTPEIQARRGRLGGLAKGVANEEKRTAAATLRTAGLTQREIADELDVSAMSVSRWLRGL